MYSVVPVMLAMHSAVCSIKSAHSFLCALRPRRILLLHSASSVILILLLHSASSVILLLHSARHHHGPRAPFLHSAQEWGKDDRNTILRRYERICSVHILGFSVCCV